MWGVIFGLIILIVKFIADRLTFWGLIPNWISQAWYFYPIGFAVIVYSLFKNILWTIGVFIIITGVMYLSGGLV